MPALVTFGRVLFAVLFMYTGATKLFAIQQTADFIATKVTIPALLAPYTSQLETMTGMPMPQMLAYGVGGFEILAGLMIAVNFGARFFAILLIFFVDRDDLLLPRFLEPAGARKCQDADRRLEEPVDHRRAVHDRGLRPRSAADRTGLRGRVVSDSIVDQAYAPPRRDADVIGRVEHLRHRRRASRAPPGSAAANAQALRESRARRRASGRAAPPRARTRRSGP